VLLLTDKGRGALSTREKIELTKPRAVAGAKKTRGAGVIAGVDEGLFERLRRWRRAAADERGVPAYVILNDAALKELSARKPRSLEQLVGVTGIGDKKRADFGRALLAEIESYLTA
jgi:ATP-dependent DNA helicase RecQ